MSRLTLSICGQHIKDGWLIQRYAYQDEVDGHTRVKDENYVLYLAERLGPSMANQEGSCWHSNEKPGDDVRRFFDIYLDIERFDKDNGIYKIDYHTYPGSPLEAVADGMEIYRAIKKFGVRPAMKRIEELKKEKSRKRK